MQKIHTIAICLSVLLTTTNLLAREGTVQQVSGDLVYVTGLNGLAPMWSNLTVQNGQETGAKLEVIKELPELVVDENCRGQRNSGEYRRYAVVLNSARNQTYRLENPGGSSTLPALIKIQI